MQALRRAGQEVLKASTRGMATASGLPDRKVAVLGAAGKQGLRRGADGWHGLQMLQEVCSLYLIMRELVVLALFCPSASWPGGLAR
jgi:hypothetical protein